MESTHSTRTSTGKKSSKKTTSITKYFEFEKQNNRYLVLENILYQEHYLEVTHHKINPMTWIIIAIIIFVIAFLLAIGYILYLFVFSKKKIS